jgi:hypothetical protein
MEILKYALSGWLLLAVSLATRAQPLPSAEQEGFRLYQPVVGGVSATEASLFVSATDSAHLCIRVYPATPSGLATDTQVVFIRLHRYADTYFAATSRLLQLQPSGVYHYSVTARGQQQSGRFRTYPVAGQKTAFTFGFGSCLEHTKPDSIFIQVSRRNPAFFLQIGDWTYPDTTPKSGNIFYSESFDRVATAYRTRYTTPHVHHVLRNLPVDYVPDDDDYVFDGNHRTGSSQWRVVDGRTELYEMPFPAQARANAIRGYQEFFPHYTLVDSTEGVYHRFTYGNADFFVLDSRLMRTPDNTPFVRKGRRYTFDAPAGHSILGARQMAWLLAGLKASTADWKFIVSGTNFNLGYRKAIHLALSLQNKKLPNGYTGLALAASMASMWVGYPESQAALINFCAANSIANVVVLSGDAHCSAIDDGTNSGLPEFMSGNLGTQNSRIPYYLQERIGLSIWNRGGQGLFGNRNFNYCFGQVEVFGSDSLRMKIIDHRNNEVASYTHLPGFVPRPVQPHKLRTRTASDRLSALGLMFGVGFRELFRRKKHN